MKKKVFVMLISFLILFCAAGLAQAREHQVKKGECLSGIAKQYGIKWEAIYNANKAIKNSNLIYPGQRLQIPETKKASKKCFVWKKGGVNPFGDRNVVKAISLFSISEEVKAAFIAAAEKGEFKTYQMAEGQELAQQIFGNYKVVDNVIVQLPESQREAKLFAEFEFSGELYFLIRPAVCGNWAWWKEEVPAEEVPPVVAEEPPPPPEEPVILPLLPEPEPEEVVVAEEPKPEPEPEEECLDCTPNVDVTIGAFADKHQSGNNPHGIWGVAAIYPCGIKDGENTHYFGIAAEGNKWEGKTNEGYNYDGDRYAFSLAYQLNRPTSVTQVRLGMGEVRNWGDITPNEFGKYEAEQTSKIVTGYIGHEMYREGDWFNRVKVSANFDYDYDNQKEDYWNDYNEGTKNALHGKPDDVSMVSAAVDASIYKINENVSLAGGASVTHYIDEPKTGVRLSPGLDFSWKGFATLFVRGNATWWSDNDHSLGVSAWVSISNLFKIIGKSISNNDVPPKFEKQTQNENVNNQTDF